MTKKRQTKPPFPGPDAHIQIRTYAVRCSPGYETSKHRHDWDQLIYANDGVMTVYSPTGCWVVPSQRAVWVPASIEHRIVMTGSVSLRTLYLIAGISQALPRDCCVVNVSPLLRELILHAVTLGMLDRTVPRHDRLIGMILDQLEAIPTIPLQLPWPRDPRAVCVSELLHDDPGRSASLAELSARAGASKRTIERLFYEETRLTFRRWRQQAQLLHALRLLAAGDSVTHVSMKVGYDSTSAFVSMFKLAMGTTPGRFYRDREPATADMSLSK